MRIVWCWRCKLDVPMLSEREYRRILRLFGKCMTARPGFRRRHGLPLGELDSDQRFKPVRDLYSELTGWPEMHHNAILHHRISLYGPPCTSCSKPLRTPRASFCAYCGQSR